MKKSIIQFITMAATFMSVATVFAQNNSNSFESARNKRLPQDVAGSPGSGSAGASQRAGTSEQQAKPKAEAAGAEKAGTFIRYRVPHASCLTAIAFALDSDPWAIAATNGIDDLDLIYTDEALLIEWSMKRVVRYRTTRGESLQSIATAFSIGREPLLKANNLSSSTETVRAGTRLIIPVRPQVEMREVAVPQARPASAPARVSGNPHAVSRVANAN